MIFSTHLRGPSEYQYGFKKSHYTSNCIFVVNEVIQYYLNNEINVFITVLDSSKAYYKYCYPEIYVL